MVCRSIFNEIYLIFLLYFAENTEYDAVNLCGSDQQNRVKKLTFQTRNFLCGVEHIVKGHFDADDISV